MHDRRILGIAGGLALALLVAPGCVTNKKFKMNVEQTDARIASVESAVEQNQTQIDGVKRDTGRRIDGVEQSANQANSIGNRALTEAEKAARGKLLWTVTLSDEKVKFPFGQAQLSTDATVMLDDLVQKIKGYGKALYIEVEGHTDDVGEENYNLALSEQRAVAVRDYMNQNGGIPLHAMNTIALGETKPVADNHDKDGRAQNRRVVIRVLE